MAGLFEGEGCIYKDPRCNSWRLTINMADKDVLDKFQKEAACGRVYKTTKKAGYKDMFTWVHYKRKDVYRLLEAMLPWFGHRRAYLALNALDAMDGI